MYCDVLCTVGALKFGLDEDNVNGMSGLFFLLLVDTFAIKICKNTYGTGIATGYGLDGPGIESRWG
jgi:hypothetical protein